MATTDYCLDNHQHGFAKQLVFSHRLKTPDNYASEKVLEMLEEYFVVDDLQCQVEQHHRLNNGRFVVDFCRRSTGSVYDRLLHWASNGLELRGWRVEIHRSPIYAEWERSKFDLIFFFS